MKYDPANLKHDDLIYGLGELAVWFNLLESHVLDETWKVVTKGRGMGHLVTDRMSYARVVELLADAYLLLVPNRKDEVERLRGELRAVSKKRNTFLHGIWAPHRDPKKVVKGTRAAKERGGWVGPEIESVRDLVATIAEVRKTTAEIRELSGRVADMSKMLPSSGPVRTS